MEKILLQLPPHKAICIVLTVPLKSFINTGGVGYNPFKPKTLVSPIKFTKVLEKEIKESFTLHPACDILSQTLSLFHRASLPTSPWHAARPKLQQTSFCAPLLQCNVMRSLPNALSLPNLLLQLLYA